MQATVKRMKKEQSKGTTSSKTKQLLDRNENISEINVQEENLPKISTNQSIRNDTNINLFLVICIIGVSLAILLEIINVQNRRGTICKDNVESRRSYCVYSAHSDVENQNGLLKHVHLVLKRLGYELRTNRTVWTLLWSHDYPFRVLYPNVHRLKANQKVNHFPGTGFITNKVDLATSDSKFIPRAYKIPKNKKEFLEYARENRNAVFLEKHNQHRGVYLKNVTAIDLSSGESFVQEYVQKPFLVDGHKFDIGVYVVLTSVNPLRVYWYKGDVLFRYCPAKYYPFDPKNLDKYVVGDDYLPTWEVPSLAHPYTSLGFSMKDSFDHYARSKGKNVTQMWEDVQEAITEVFVKKEHHIISALKNYPSQDNFFELMRFDLVVDEDLKVYLLEANMSPNLSSAHYPPNQLLYEQVLFNLFSLIGLATHINDSNEDQGTRNMLSSQKNIAVYSEECSSLCKDSCEVSDVCTLCRHCISPRLRNSLLIAYRENLGKGDYRRLFPPATKPYQNIHQKMKNLTQINGLQYLWYQGKCNTDISWCA